jgi:hypothetical protein
MSLVNPIDKDSVESIRYRVGNGHWEAFGQSGLKLPDLFEAAADWAKQLSGVELPWLCWNVRSDWCLIQQKLVSEVGWTPVVGFDPRVGKPPLVPGAIEIDFNRCLGLPSMWMHFPMELTFLISDRMAFWHSDLLVRRSKMQRLASMFATLKDGEMAAVHPGWSWREWLDPHKQRYFELIGCNTRGSSRSQFENGCGWWMDFWQHPSTPTGQKELRSKYWYEHGIGIRYWKKHFGGKVKLVKSNYVDEGHCTRIGKPSYVPKSPVNYRLDLSLDLPHNYNLKDVCQKLDIADLLTAIDLD